MKKPVKEIIPSTKGALQNSEGKKNIADLVTGASAFFFSLEISQSFCLTIRFLGVLHSHRDNEMSLQALQVVGPLEGGHNVVENM